MLLVIVVHTPGLVPRYAADFPKGAFLGVDIFFVLSGFLITSILLTEDAQGGIRFLAFYRRRAMRLLPALGFMLAVYVVYASVTDLPGSNVFPATLSIIFYYSNWLSVWTGVTYPPGLEHTWSLALEEQFYFVWPVVLALFFGYRRSLKIVTIGMVAVIAAIAIHRLQLLNAHVPRGDLFGRTDTRTDSMLCGALLAQFYVRGLTARIPKWLVAAAGLVGLCVFLIVFQHDVVDAYMYRGGFTLAAISIAVMLLAVLELSWFAAPLTFAPLRAVGWISYGLYLWHLPVFTAVARYGLADIAPLPRVVLAYSLTASLALASWFLVERPFLRWKDSLERRDARAREDVRGTTPRTV